MKVSQCYILFLSIIRNYNNLGFDPYKFFQFIEKFTFQYSVVCKLPGNRLEKIYSKAALDIQEAAKTGPNDKTRQKLQSIFSGIQNDLKDISPSENVFLEYFPDISYKNNEETRRLIKYILNKFNSYYQKTDEYVINYSSVNIEHVLPQTPDKDWGLSKKDIKDYVNRLGNLTLLSQVLNSKAQNSVVSIKLGEFRKSELAITKELVTKLDKLGGNWGEFEITERQKELGEIAYRNIWSI